MRTAAIVAVLTLLVVSHAGAAEPDAHARAEFITYAAKVTGKPAAADASGACTIEGTPPAFLIGRCPATEALIAAGKLRVPGDLGDEGFLIRSVEDGPRRYVVILGGARVERSTGCTTISRSSAAWGSSGTASRCRGSSRCRPRGSTWSSGPAGPCGST